MTDLFFCNFCDQSVPQGQLDAREAIRHGGRVVCPTCCDTLTMAVRHQRGSLGGGGLSGLIGLILSVVAVAGVGYLYWQQGEAQKDQTQQLNGSIVELSEARVDLEDSLDKRFDAMTGQLADIRSGVGANDASAIQLQEEIGERLGTMNERLDLLDDLQSGQQAVQDGLQRIQARMGIVEDSQRELRSAQEFLRDSFSQVQREVAAAQVPEPQDSGFSSEIEALLEKLQADDPLSRVDALQKLARFQDPQLIAYVEPLLEDSYEMNRFYAAYTLGEWSSLGSVPKLIPVLEDQFAFVRQSANEALVKITKEDLGFEEKGSEAERAKAVARWQDWAKKHESEF